ncbi:hypothetical protein FI667_g15007, partial [Globisporangium splendens]
MDATEDGRMSEASSARNRGRRRSIASPMMDDMMDDMNATHGSSAHGGQLRPQLRCNACWELVLPDPQSAQTCYRTTCSHLFCAIWEEMIADPSACFGKKKPQISIARCSSTDTVHLLHRTLPTIADINLRKTYTGTVLNQIEAELREIKSKMQSLTTSNEELREAYKEKSRKCRNWEKMYKALKGQSANRQYPSPGSTVSAAPPMMRSENNREGQSPAFAARPLVRPYISSSQMMRPQLSSMPRPESPVQQRSSGGMFDRFARPQLGTTAFIEIISNSFS